jgi:O-antigen/teichoic acid export membrane protein
LTLTFFITSVMGRLDFFFLYRIRGAEAAGVYAAAVQLSLAVTILIGVITTVMTPYASERITYDLKVDFLKRVLPAVGLLAVALIVSSVTYPALIQLLFGEKYAAAATPLTILIVHLAINVVLIPISLMYVPLGKVRIGTYISVFQLITAVVLYPVLIGARGAVGAALTVLVTSLIGLVIYTLMLGRLMRREKRQERLAARLADQPA